MSTGAATNANCVLNDQDVEAVPLTADSQTNPFLSCDFIEKGLVFFPQRYVVCCAGMRPGWQDVGHFDSRTELPIDSLQNVRKKLRAANRKGGHPLCHKCGHLAMRPWPRNPEHLISLINLSHFINCNAKCCYCYTQHSKEGLPEAGRRPSSPVKTLKTLIDRGALSPHTTVLWGGGEPTILADFDTLISLLADHGCQQVVSSNCIKLSDPLAENLRERGTVRLNCSLDSGTPETFRDVKGVDAFDRVRENLAAYCNTAKHRESVALKYIFLRGRNLQDKDIQGFVDVVCGNGISRCICDVDASFKEKIPSDVLEAMARMIYELESRAVDVAIQGPGVVHHVGERLKQRLSQILYQRFHLPQGTVAKCFPDAAWSHPGE